MAEDTKDYEGGELEGQSFRNEALTGSGTILPDGVYGDPLPDPTEVRGIGPRRTSGGRLVPDANDLAETEKIVTSEGMRLEAQRKEAEKDTSASARTEPEKDTSASARTETPKKATGTAK